ncbi:sulfurtransferase TusA family protein [Synechococcus sp. 1G10]|uniref:sulfurtransferase TusA family protein n=1 Tax=Synechococcus sp. 1G10 TaxID=2025605 RepID=UPI001E615F64|nr:sulfurtransferase TusA family protein [Synechococcus sp. 1G10]
MTCSPASGSPPAEPTLRLDLRGTPCPLNFIRSRLALETIAAGEWLQLDLDTGEPELMVAEGLRQEGHRVERISREAEHAQDADVQQGVRFWICRHGG